ncbi:MAG: protoporphyrinogen oxidase [Acidimicrobiales bacterium]
MPQPDGHGVAVAVVGGGITGLATAWFLRQAGATVTLYEAGERLGGKIQTGDLDGVPVALGPDTFLARVPWAVDLCRDLGLGDELVAPATGKAYVWTRGRLRPLPAGTVLGVPARLGPLARTGIVSPLGMARAGLDLVLPRPRLGHDPSVADVVGARFGAEVVDRLVEPLIGGIHAGRADRLSLASVAPQVAEPAAASRSLMRGLLEAPQEPGGPLFLGLRGGLGRLVDRLAERLDGVDVRLGSPVSELPAGPVVVTVPAPAAASLLPAAAGDLRAIEYASVATVTLAYLFDALPGSLDGSGFLVPRVDGRLTTACTWLTSKWPELAASGRVLLRASAGCMGDDRAMALDDATLAARLHAELADAMGLRREPEEALVTRWPLSFPQYDVGHAARVARIEAALPSGVFVAGAAYRGVGIAACVQQARQAAAAVLASAL